jgi:hypothetical protein
VGKIQQFIQAASCQSDDVIAAAVSARSGE